MLGLERGIIRSGISLRTVCYVEIEAFIIENLVKQMEKGVLDEAPVWTDIKTFPARNFHGRVHGIVGGYPCQPFSNAGQRKGDADPRHLWPFIKEHIRAVEPIWCFFENVPGHLTIGYQQVRSDLQDLGYTVTEGLFSAEEVGAPHKRERLFILAVTRGVDLVNAPCRWSGRVQNQTGEGKGYGLTGASGVLSTAGVGLADSESGGMERNGTEGEQKPEIQTGKEISGCDSGRDQWPARRNEQQYEWEAPRLESSLGFTVNGYNFRADLLRMAGNGVVEQTAELAWNTLWNKITHG